MKVEVVVGHLLVPNRFNQALQRSRADGVGEGIPGGLAQLTVPFQFGGRQMDGIGQGAEEPDLVLFDRGGNGRPCPTRILATKRLDSPLRRRQRLPLKMSIHGIRIRRKTEDGRRSELPTAAFRLLTQTS